MPIRIESGRARPTREEIVNSKLNAAAARLLARARKEADASQGEFAEQLRRRLGLAALNQSTISDWESAKRAVPAAALIAAAEVAKMDPAELFARETKRVGQAERLIRDIEKLTGLALTDEQAERVRERT